MAEVVENLPAHKEEELQAVGKELWGALDWMIVKCRFESQEGRRVRDKHRERFASDLS